MFEKMEYVYAVYREKSFTKAAEKLFLTQPSLSAAIRRIEEEVGAPIFHRGRPVTLTEVGREYIAAAERMMREEEEFLKRVNDIYALEVGHITVGGSNYLSSYVLPRIISRFSERYPRVEVELAEGSSKALEQMLRGGELDIVVDSFDELPDGYRGYPLTRERILLCVPSELPVNRALTRHAISPKELYEGKSDALEKPPVPLATFREESFVLLKSGNDMYERAMRLFEREQLEPRVIFRVDQLNISYFLAEAGTGLCFLTDTLFRFASFRNRVTLYNVSAFPSRTLYIAHKKDQYCTGAMQKFIEIAREVIGSEGEGLFKN